MNTFPDLTRLYGAAVHEHESWEGLGAPHEDTFKYPTTFKFEASHVLIHVVSVKHADATIANPDLRRASYPTEGAPFQLHRAPTL